MIAVRAATGRGDLRRFVDYAYDRNAGDPRWIPPLRIGERERLTPSKNPFFAHADVELFLAWRGGRIAGRIAAVDDRLHNETHRDNVAMFGFFEADDAEAARALTAAVEGWARARGRARVRGPLNPSLNESAGLLVDGFDTPPMVMMPHNPPEYAAFLESAGYAKVKDLLAWIWDPAPEPPPIFTKLSDRVRDKYGITLRPLRVSEFAREVERLRDVYCSAWERNWGFVAPTAAEFRRIAAELKPIFDPQAAVVAEENGRLVACVVAIPDVNQALATTTGRLTPRTIYRLLRRSRYIDQARLILLGVDPAYRAAGLFPLLMRTLRDQLLKSSYRRVELSWVLEDNRDVNQAAELGGAKLYKRYRVFQKAIA
ncbi:MAG TPA: GNAT family N-acetyltransferase [Vicinamibacterales bacterium]|nr:GNAT family N-acetyltransferase [Vicinamibacterales bacterium]